MIITLELNHDEAMQVQDALIDRSRKLRKDYGALPLAQDDQRATESALTKINEELNG